MYKRGLISVQEAARDLVSNKFTVGQSAYVADGIYMLDYNDFARVENGVVVERCRNGGIEMNLGGHTHDFVDLSLDRDRIRSLSSSVTTISGKVSGSGLKSFSFDLARRECPPNKVVIYNQCIWNIDSSARDNLAIMKVNDYYKLSGKTVSQILEKSVTDRFDIEVWFEDDRQFHVYKNDKRIFESKSAKATAAFIEDGLK